MFNIIYAIVSFSLAASADSASKDITAAVERCGITTPGESLLYSDEFQNPAKHLDSMWWYTLPETAAQFEITYSSGKRLPKRAYYDSEKKKFVMPLDQDQPVELTENFILSVQKHIETALAAKYAEYIFFPDMGHSHLYFPQAHWDAKYKTFSTEKTKAELYSKMLGDKELRVLYHTAEKLLLHDESKVLLPDPHLQFRYWNRNIVGTNVQSSEVKVFVSEDLTKYNTVTSLEGFKSWSAGFSLNASKDGCFPFSYGGKTYYFDLSLFDLEKDPSTPWSDGDYL